MRCLYKDCPMSGREYCPASLECDKFRRTFDIRIGTQNIELSPSEAVKLFTKLEQVFCAARIRDFDNIPEYWPSDKD